jgi:hypothetical protein
MRVGAETIVLGEQQWTIRPLTLAQVQAIEPILMESTFESKGHISAAMFIVAIALRRDHPEAASTLSEIEATASEIGAAMAVVLKLGGFVETSSGTEPRPGEAVAGALQGGSPPA